ncbi:LacI family DNA-binding transcriptional regulator [Neobacillus sp. SM06]|uniref:LacI family DNA-binding transcriptional regulator n=1 Tax=Neobacillus sp. SM06 TaxID=3422492 RepID=UPI003D2DDA96
MNPTIKDVAKKANVSIATVSRILNNKPGFSEETKQKVLKVIGELGYQPNAVARGLVNKRTETIGVLIPKVSDMLAAEILNGIDDFAHRLGLSVIVCNTDSNGKRTMDYLRILAEKRIDGIILVSEFVTEAYYQAIVEMKVPVVLVSTISYQFLLPYVKVDDRHAAFSATDYLIRHGHRKIAMVTGSESDPVAGIPRIEGYKSALRLHGLEIDENQIINAANFRFEDGMKAMEEIIRRKLDMTAIFASSDELAAGAMSKAFQHGIQIPSQLSIISYDNTKLAEMVTPPLTAVSQPLYEMGKTAATMLFEMVESGDKMVESRIMPHTIVERQTVQMLGDEANMPK